MRGLGSFFGVAFLGNTNDFVAVLVTGRGQGKGFGGERGASHAVDRKTGDELVALESD